MPGAIQSGEITTSVRPEEKQVKHPVNRKQYARRTLIKKHGAEVSGLKATIDEANQKAETDKLTGLPNDKALDRIMNQYMEESIRFGIGFVVMYGDLGGLKWINDNRGDPEGDKYLQNAAKILSGNIRGLTDAVVRPHGDTFIVFLANTGQEGAVSFFDKVNPQLINGNQELNADGNIAMSFGAVIVSPERFKHPETLRGKNLSEQKIQRLEISEDILSEANKAMNTAKRPDTRGLPPRPENNRLYISEVT